MGAEWVLTIVIHYNSIVSRKKSLSHSVTVTESREQCDRIGKESVRQLKGSMDRSAIKYDQVLHWCGNTVVVKKQ